MSDKTRKLGVWQSGLGIRFLAIVSLALLPVAALSIWQGIERIRLDQEHVRETLRQSALTAASDEASIFTVSEQLLQTLAKQVEIRFGNNGCDRRLEDSVRDLTVFENIARASPDGAILCAAVRPPPDFNVTKLAWWNEALVRREFFIGGLFYSEALRKNAFAAVLPLMGADGAFEGILYAAIDPERLTFELSQQKKLPPGALVAIFEKSGSVVASNAPMIAATVFAGGPGLAKGNDGMRSARGPDDEAWSLAIAPVLRHDYFVGFAMRDSDLSRLSYIYVAVDLFLPLLMIILASLAIWLATDRLVIRWIDVLARMATVYAGGHYAIRPQALNEAPREFRELGNTLSDMALAVQERDRALKEALGQKELLIKEIHHRVKNTLQIVMSLLSLQANRLRDPNAREAMGQARARINALALAHRAIYELDLGSSVDLKPLLSDAIEQVQRADDGAHAHMTVSMDVDPCRVSGDTAIPLVLFLTEAMTNAYKHGNPESNRGSHISVSLKPDGNGRMDLVIADDGEGLEPESEPPDAAIGTRLMTALAQQISGKVSMQSSKGGTIVKLNFAPDRPTMATQV